MMTNHELLLVFTLMWVHSACSLVEIDPAPSVLSCKKCSPGYSSFCKRGNQASLCVPCEEGTYSENPSRRSTCKPCSSCRSNEFESQSCTPTSNTECKKCSKCASGFWKVKPCGRTRDTVCEECPQNGKAIMSHANVQCNEIGMKDHLISMARKQSGKTKSSLTIIEKEIPWSVDKRKLKHQDEKFTVEKQLNVTASSSGFPSRDQAPSSSFSTKQNGTSTQMAFSSHSVPVSPSGIAFSSVSTCGLPKSISPTNAPTMPAKQRSSPHPPNVPRTKQTIESKFLITKESLSHEIQEGPGVPELSGQMPVPTNGNKSREIHIVVAPVVVIVLVLVLLGVRKIKGRFFECRHATCRRPRCPASSDCCDGTSVSSIAASYAEQQNQMENPVDHGFPVTVTYENESDESPPSSNPECTVVVAAVHHDAVFNYNFFNVIKQVGNTARSCLQYITQAATTINSTGGKLSSPDSNISIIVDKGAVPEGINQPFYFHVVYDETSLLRDIQEGPDRTLICPVFYCGPENINLLKPVEIIVPHCLYLDEVKKGSISVYRCSTYAEDGPLKWEKVPSASEKNSQSKAWYTVKKDSVHIKTKRFSFWSIFLCGGGGPKRKRATVFASKPSEEFDTICFRFYIYNDNEDSKKRVQMKDTGLFPNSKQMNEVVFKIYNDAKDIIVRLVDLQEGWEMDKTPGTQIYPYEMAYHNGFRADTSYEFAVKPCRPTQQPFSCNLTFQQEEHPPEQRIYLNPGFTPREQTRPRLSVKSSEDNAPSHNTTATGSRISVVREEDEAIDYQESKSSPDFSASQHSNHCFSSLGSDDEPVTQSHCNCISELVGVRWKKVLRNLDVAEVPTIENVDYRHESVEEKCYQGLVMWMRSHGTQTATTKKLCDALRRTGCTEALEALSKAGVDCVPPVSIPERTTDQPGTPVQAASPVSHPCKGLDSAYKTSFAFSAGLNTTLKQETQFH